MDKPGDEQMRALGRRDDEPAFIKAA